MQSCRIKYMFKKELHCKNRFRWKLLQDSQRVSNWEQFKLLSSLIWFEIFGQISNLQFQVENNKIYLVSSVFSRWTFATSAALCNPLSTMVIYRVVAKYWENFGWKIGARVLCLNQIINSWLKCMWKFNFNISKKFSISLEYERRGVGRYEIDSTKGQV